MHIRLPLALIGLLFAPAAAEASSIVFQKAGDLYLTSPDLSTGYRLTTDGGWSSPSQADDGTIVAMRSGELWHLSRSGKALGPPVTGIGGATDPSIHNADQFFGPFDPVVSPDGTQIAYWDTVQVHESDPSCSCTYETLRNLTTTTAVDHFTSPGMVPRVEQPHWITGTDRVVVTDSGEGPQTATWVPGHDQSGEQWWFQDTQHVVTNSSLSPDATKVIAMGTDQGITHPDDLLLIYTTNGPAFTGQPPYDNNASDAQFPPAPTLQCRDHRGAQIDHPSWSPDSTQLAYDAPDGIYVETIPAQMSNCAGVTARLLIPDGHQPGWGPVDVDLRQAPGTPGGDTPGGGTPGGGTPGGGTPGGGTPGGLTIAKAPSRISAHKATVEGIPLTLAAATPGTLRLRAVSGGRTLANKAVSIMRAGRVRLRLRLRHARRHRRVRIVVSENGQTAQAVVSVV
jgi:hypothetical protein